MSILIATLGNSESIVKLGFRTVENVEKVLLIPGKPFSEVLKEGEIKKEKEQVDPVQKAKKLQKELETFGTHVEIHPVNPVDFKECILKIIELIQKQPKNSHIVVNVTGGNKILSLAAMNAASMCYCDAFYVQEKESGDIKLDLPTPNSSYFRNIKDQQRRILSYILHEQNKLGKSIEQCQDEDLRPLITKRIAEGLKVNTSSISSNIGQLESMGLVKNKTVALKREKSFGGKSPAKSWWLTSDGIIYATYFENKDCS